MDGIHVGTEEIVADADGKTDHKSTLIESGVFVSGNATTDANGAYTTITKDSPLYGLGVDFKTAPKNAVAGSIKYDDTGRINEYQTTDGKTIKLSYESVEVPDSNLPSYAPVDGKTNINSQSFTRVTWEAWDLGEIRNEEQPDDQWTISSGKDESGGLTYTIVDKKNNVTYADLIRVGSNSYTKTVTDENGRFTIPVEDFAGATEAVIQTRKVGKERNKDASILIDRNFSPAPRAYGYKELHPEWKDLTHWLQKAENFDSLYMDSIRKVEGLYVLDEVEIKSKRRQGSNMATKINEKSIDAYYDVRRSVDLLRDNGKIVTTIPELMEKLSPQFDWDRSNDKLTYRQKPICYIMDNHILSETETQMMLTEVDGLASIIISKGTGGIDDDIIQNTKMSEVTDSTGVDISKLDKYSVFYLIPLPRRDVLNKSQTAVLGTRQTVIQGYTHALEYYSPAYPTKELYMDKVDKRRTLYWNPSVRTDENGKAVIECYNNQYSTPVIIQAETMSKDGQIGSMKYSTIGQAEQ